MGEHASVLAPRRHPAWVSAQPVSQPNPYSPPKSTAAPATAAKARRPGVLSWIVTVVVSLAAGMGTSWLIARPLVWVPRTDRYSTFVVDTLDLPAGVPMILNNVMLAVAAAALVYPLVGRHLGLVRWLISSAVVVAIAIMGAVVQKAMGLAHIGGTEAVLLHNAITSAAIGVLLCVALSWRTE
jgi:hypothetical protein